MEGLKRDLQERIRNNKMLPYFTNRPRKQTCSCYGSVYVLSTYDCLFSSVNTIFMWALILLSWVRTINHVCGTVGPWIICIPFISVCGFNHFVEQHLDQLSQHEYKLDYLELECYGY